MSIFTQKTILSRQNKTAQALDAVTKPGDMVIVFSGSPIQKPGGLDQTYPFLPHPEYFWLTGSRRFDGIILYQHQKSWTLFEKHIDAAEKIWEGASEVILGQDVLTINDWIQQQDAQNFYFLGQVTSQLKTTASKNTEQLALIQNAIDQVRRIKDEEEINLILKASHAAAQAFQKVREFIRPGVTERQIQIEFEAEAQRNGAHKMPYGSIVGTGTNAAILHFEPSNQIVQKDDLILIDAGSDIHDYCVDITRVFPASGKFTEQQQQIYNIVLKAQEAGIELCRPGVEWHDVHRAAAQVITEGLIEIGILVGQSQDLIDSGATALFFPHGIGHMVGQRVRDVGGSQLGRAPRTCCGVRVRVDLPLEVGFNMTVEPGLYFIDAIIHNPEVRKQHANAVNWKLVDDWKHVGGVRIEDNILVTAQGPRNLTAQIPK